MRCKWKLNIVIVFLKKNIVIVFYMHLYTGYIKSQDGEIFRKLIADLTDRPSVH